MSRKVLVQRLLTLGHVAGFALFLGGTLAILVLVLTGESMAGGAHRAFALASTARIQAFVLQPGMVLALLSGVLLSATGPWGFVKHRWMVGKLLLTGILVVHTKFSFGPKTHKLLAMLQGVPGGQIPPEYGDLMSFYLRVVVIQALVLLALAGLGILKPWGRTRYAQASQPVPKEASSSPAASR
jgi:hypothetical protein